MFSQNDLRPFFGPQESKFYSENASPVSHRLSFSARNSVQQSGSTGRAIDVAQRGAGKSERNDVTPAPDRSWTGDDVVGTPAAETRRSLAPAVKTIDPHDVWRQLQSELAIEQNGALDRWIHDTWVIAYEDGLFIVGLPDAFRYDWVETRLRPKIKRKLAVIMGRSSVDVRFQVQPRPVQDAPQAAPAPLYEQRGADEPAAIDFARPQRPAAPVEPAKPAMTLSPNVNVRHTFANFVVGSHNKLAHAVATAVAQQPGGASNPLFVYGGVGLGKTHLLHAIAIRAAELGYNVLYVTSEEFTNELITAIRHQTTDLFRAKYRQVDLLLIDDIQFISGKESTQEEFFHTFNYLHAAGKQIVISSDRPPKALATLAERLRSRFEGGFRPICRRRILKHAWRFCKRLWRARVSVPRWMS
ncbi:MAG: ATP-binding protein [Anaerolineales bacterium]|nr:ATP-binding protein [Anaerolineales bacterium]